MNIRLAIAIEELQNQERVAEHFGSCTKFKVYELDENKNIVKEEAYFNPLSGEHRGVCQLPGYIKQFNVNTVIAGGMGQKAFRNFQNFGIEVLEAPGLYIQEALAKFISGELNELKICSSHHHHHHNHHHHHHHHNHNEN